MPLSSVIPFQSTYFVLFWLFVFSGRPALLHQLTLNGLIALRACSTLCALPLVDIANRATAPVRETLEIFEAQAITGCH